MSTARIHAHIHIYIGNHAQAMGRVAQLLDEHCTLDFVDINMGCPIDAVCNKGMGASLAQRSSRVQVSRDVGRTACRSRLPFPHHTAVLTPLTYSRTHSLTRSLAHWLACAVDRPLDVVGAQLPPDGQDAYRV